MAEFEHDYRNLPLRELDPDIAEVLDRELARQRRTLTLIASENLVPNGILEALGSVLTNKYAEGYPGHRLYPGCDEVDVAEQLAIVRAEDLFGAQHANVQPYSGTTANECVYKALLRPGDTILGHSTNHGGSVDEDIIGAEEATYRTAVYGTDPNTGMVDMDAVSRLARQHRPKALIAGWSAYPRVLDFVAFRAIADEVGALLIVDMAHFAGLVAAGVHPNPTPYADAVTMTVQKTLGGPRGGVILCREEHAAQIDASVFPGQQGGPHEQTIAGKAVAMRIAGSSQFESVQRNTIAGARALAEAILQAKTNVGVLTGGTDVHLVVVDLRDAHISGAEAEGRLEDINILTTRLLLPGDHRSPEATSGLRVGAAALAARGVSPADFTEIGEVIATALSDNFHRRRSELLDRVAAIAARYPIYPHWIDPGRPSQAPTQPGA